MDLKKQGAISNVLQKFNRQVAKIFKIIDKHNPGNSDIEHVKTIIRLCRDITPDRVIREAGDKMWDQREKIIERDLTYFTKPNNMSTYAGDEKTKDLVDSIILFGKEECDKLSSDEMDYMWSCVNAMLTYVIEYRILQGDYTE
jgi:Ca2+-binding EF-hand superfamily protein